MVQVALGPDASAERVSPFALLPLAGELHQLVFQGIFTVVLFINCTSFKIRYCYGKKKIF